jgi:hypothetical protein
MHRSGSYTLACRYTKLWHRTLKRRQIKKNTYLEYITWIVTHTLRILPKPVATYEGLLRFIANMHHMYLQAMKEPTQQWMQMSYSVKAKEVGPKITEWYKEMNKGDHCWVCFIVISLGKVFHFSSFFMFPCFMSIVGWFFDTWFLPMILYFQLMK